MTNNFNQVGQRAHVIDLTTIPSVRAGTDLLVKGLARRSDAPKSSKLMQVFSAPIVIDVSNHALILEVAGGSRASCVLGADSRESYGSLEDRAHRARWALERASGAARPS